MSVRLFTLLPLMLLGACNGGSSDEGAASGEVLEGTISDAMLPIDTVRSEPPLEDPEAFAQAQSEAAEADAAAAEGEGAAEGEPAEPAAEAPPAEEPAAEPAD